VIVQLKDQNAPFMIYVHCVTHVAPIWWSKLFLSMALWEELKMCCEVYMHIFLIGQKEFRSLLN
jgi:hypothetical protein